MVWNDRFSLLELGGQDPPGQCHTNVFLPASANTFHNCSALQVRESKAYGAKEFSIILANGMKRWVCLLEPNAEGIYDTVAIYKKKQDEQPLAIVKNNVQRFVQSF